ncbi:MAG: tRNA pseudouridine(54/55) synthase Pus10 [Halobacteriota archaeon]
MFDVVRSILSEGPICDDCLGRQFAKCSTNLTNKQRGSALRIVSAMISDEPFSPPDGRDPDSSCWVCGGLFAQLGTWVERCVTTLDGAEVSTFLVGTKLSGRLAENEEIIWAESKTTTAEPLKSALNREIGKRIEALTGSKADFQRPDVLLLIDLGRDKVEAQIHPLFVYGRYTKLVRGIPQTRWPCGECGGKGCPRCDYKGKMYPESVQEIIEAPILHTAEGTGTVFHGAGREDIDALMLGTGRPFVLEITSPRKRTFDLQALENAINTAQEKVAVNGLRFADHKAVVKIKNTESDKVYRLKVIYEDPVDPKKLKAALKRLQGEIEQVTPQRVAHRRADLKRYKKVYSADLKGDEIIIRCEGGLYVKELISGDNGRTNPNLSALIGTHAAVDELDVLEVEGGL